MAFSLFSKEPDYVIRQMSGNGVLSQAFAMFFLGFFGYALLASMIPGVSDLDRGSIGLIVMTITVGCAILPITRYFRVRSQLKRHQADLVAFCAEHSYAFESLPLAVGRAFEGSSLIELGERDASFRNLIAAPHWGYVEFSYAIYNRTKYGEFKAQTVYYGVMSVDLPRALPHVFFDSKRARGRQFRWIFTNDQARSLEGDFDEFFTTYFPPDYTIDGLSFITPEVMWALREAAEYDFEIVDNRLYLYAPIYHDENRLEAMAAKLLNIKDKLLHNIVTYHDDRLPGVAGRMGVAAGGLRLKRSQFLKGLSFIVVGIYLLVRLWLEVQK